MLQQETSLQQSRLFTSQKVNGLIHWPDQYHSVGQDTDPQLDKTSGHKLKKHWFVCSE